MHRKKTMVFMVSCFIILFTHALGAQENKACSAMTRTECTASKRCVLELIPKKEPIDPIYRCRPAHPPCETLDLEQCKSAKHCAYDPGGCYCRCKGYGSTVAGDDDASSCKCYCGFGAPPLCKSSRK